MCTTLLETHTCRKMGNVANGCNAYSDLTSKTYCVTYLLEAELFILNTLGVAFIEERDKSVLNLYNNFLFTKCFVDFFQKMQLDGIEAARKFWDSYPYKNIYPPNASDIFEKMINFYIDLSNVPKEQFNALITRSSQESRRALDGFLDILFQRKEDTNAFGWGPSRAYHPGTHIVRQDTPAKAVFLVESGLLKLSRIVHTGSEVIAGLRRQHWIIGAPAVLLGKAYSFTATTLTHCSLRSVSAETFLNTVSTDTHFSFQMLLVLSQEYYNQSETLVGLGCLAAIDRLKRLLYEITAEVQGSSKRVKIEVPLKHQEMAQMIAVTPEYLCRLLKKLEQEKIITRDEGSLIVNDTQSLKKGCTL